jgi:hypothetical protein
LDAAQASAPPIFTSDGKENTEEPLIQVALKPGEGKNVFINLDCNILHCVRMRYEIELESDTPLSVIKSIQVSLQIRGYPGRLASSPDDNDWSYETNEVLEPGILEELRGIRGVRDIRAV